MFKWGGTKCKQGTFTPEANQFHVNVGFKPKYLAISCFRTNNYAGTSYMYNEDVSSTKYIYSSSDSGGTLSTQDLGTSTTYRLYSIDDDGFTMNAFTTSSWRGNAYYIAIG